MCYFLCVTVSITYKALYNRIVAEFLETKGIFAFWEKKKIWYVHTVEYYADV